MATPALTGPWISQDGGAVHTAKPAHPRRGVHQPVVGSPSRRPGSVRRTSTVDMNRPDGLFGPVVVDARCRDLHADADGSTHHAETRIDAEVDYAAGRVLTRIASDPSEPRLEQFLGASLSSGFRRRIPEVVPDHVEAVTRLHLLLDDLPVAMLVGGYAISAAGVIKKVERAAYARPDLCSGWRSDGTIMLGITSKGAIPELNGPLAPSLDNPDDPDAWHAREPLGPHGVRRARCLDVALVDGPVGRVVEVDSFYRDSHRSAEGNETVVHEYTLHGHVDPDTLRILDMRAEARVLPWAECPAAVGSADRLPGMDVRTLRPVIRSTFTGTTTCTHLNDQMRALADIPALLT